MEREPLHRNNLETTEMTIVWLIARFTKEIFDMKTVYMRQHPSFLLAPLLLLIAGAVVAQTLPTSSVCSAPRITASSQPSFVPRGPSHHSYDGRTLFRGLFFGSGPVADLFPEVYGRATLKQQVSMKQNDWLDKIDSADPTFFRRFEENINSHERLLVRQALKNGSDKVVDLLAAESGTSTPEVRNSKVQDTAGAGLGFAVNVFQIANEFLAVYKYAAVADHVALWTHGFLFGVGPSVGLQNSRLAQDRLVNLVVSRV
jgi:SdpC family antimicrobial peptide